MGNKLLVVRLTSSPDHTYQVLSFDQDSDLYLIRRWPLSKQGSPAFAVAQQQLKDMDLAAV
jgi:hypothetical protein